MNHLYLVLFFLGVYSLINMEEHFGVPNSLSNVCYFTVTTHTTTGFGDITPKTSLAKWLVSLHMVATWLIVAFF
jgi:hypothetical protein